ncbi:MAG: ATP phosphoribosyltransferase [Paracoccaceae bacterium]|nr:ATP phosphoribosyltransferase [Paracoccaceae bacterium]
MTFKLGIPSKGRLMDKTFDWFQSRGVLISHSGSEREYSAEIKGGSGIQLVLLSAGEIPRELAVGRIQLGVTGTDLIREKLVNWQTIVDPIAELGFGYANLIIAVPSCWVDVDRLDDFDAVAASFRKTHGFRLRIATKYHRLVREFLQNEGIADYQIVDSQGATEGTVKNQTAEAIADITSSGQTLKVNHLKILQDGLVLESQATLFYAKKHNLDQEHAKVLAHFIDGLGL